MRASPTPELTIVSSAFGRCSVKAGGLLGLEFFPITVEVVARRGPACFQLAGLAETAVREARIRLHGALSQLGISLDEYALTVNLAPAHLRKAGTGLDLAIAVGILGAIGRITPPAVEDALCVAEISLSGELRPVPGVLPLVLGASHRGLSDVFVAPENAREAAQQDTLRVRAARNLSQLIEHLEGRAQIPLTRQTELADHPEAGVGLEDVRGQQSAKRALCIAAAGGHHVLLVGPPGSGKSLLARRLPSLLPPLDRRQALEATSIHSVAGLLKAESGIVTERPFRAPHHTVSEAGLIGGGSQPRPGEISLAHHGVLFLDELPEFRRSALEALRQPLEDHQVHIVRSKMQATFPARPQLVCAMNPCPCGNLGHPKIPCRCAPEARRRYRGKISGPLLDRLDLHVVLPPADLSSWGRPSAEPAQDTEPPRRFVARARERQTRRQMESGLPCELNSGLSLDEAEREARLDREGQELLSRASQQLSLSARGYLRVLRVARTIADLADRDAVDRSHLAEALQYRMLDPMGAF